MMITLFTECHMAIPAIQPTFITFSDVYKTFLIVIIGAHLIMIFPKYQNEYADGWAFRSTATS